MARIRCHYVDCIHLEDEFCGAAHVELDPDEGCQTYTRADSQFDDDWVDEEEEDELSDWDEEELDEWYVDEEDDDLDLNLEDEDEY